MVEKKRRPLLPSSTRGKRYIAERIRDLFRDSGDSSLSVSRVASRMGVKDRSTQMLIGATLQEMANAGELDRIGMGRYALPARRDTLEGTIRFDKRGDASLERPDGGGVIKIEKQRTSHALPGDMVRVVGRTGRGGNGTVWQVVQVVSQGRRSYVGRVDMGDDIAFVKVDDRAMPFDIYVPLNDLGGAKDRDRVLVEITSWPDAVSKPYGVVRMRFGQVGEHAAEMHAILAEYGITPDYPTSLNKLAESIPMELPPEEVARRKDFRKVFTLTIDPATAKDFDDAISYRRLEDGTREVGVHIADVSYYVQPGSPIDEEALERATSVYLVDRTVPMLPERLCNGVCSLRPDEDKLTYSVVFTLDGDGNILSSWIGRTVIRSQVRLTYEEAQLLIEGGTAPYADTVRDLSCMAQSIRTRRMEAGAVDFASQEVRFILDEKGSPVGVESAEYNESHQLIEEYMLMANRAVAQQLSIRQKGKGEPVAVYRVHAAPDPERVEKLAHVLRQLGKPVPVDLRKVSGLDITSMARSVRGEAVQRMVDILAVRAMAKAVYTTHNIGHFGLGFEHYTHFTSPIRRYPDLLVHRLLALREAGQEGPDAEELEALCEHCSAREKRAADAERASITYKQVEYLTRYLGQRFGGVISGVQNFGLFVELEGNKCEGLVPIRDLTDDYYLFDEDGLALLGERTGRVIALGDTVEVVVARADLDERQVDFTLYSHKGRLVQHPEPRSQSYERERGGGRDSRDGRGRGASFRASGGRDGKWRGGGGRPPRRGERPRGKGGAGGRHGKEGTRRGR